MQSADAVRVGQQQPELFSAVAGNHVGWAPQARLHGAGNAPQTLITGLVAEVHDAGDAECRHAALFGFVGFPATWRRRMGRQPLIDACVAQLGRLFGPEALTPRSVYLQDWAEEADTATPADAQPTSAHPEPMSTDLPAPWCDHIHLAGSEFAPDFPGYLEGAVLAAERAVGALQAQREHSSHRPNAGDWSIAT
jgi:monoamine oxidase